MPKGEGVLPAPCRGPSGRLVIRAQDDRANLPCVKRPVTIGIRCQQRAQEVGLCLIQRPLSGRPAFRGRFRASISAIASASAAANRRSIRPGAEARVSAMGSSIPCRVSLSSPPNPATPSGTIRASLPVLPRP